MASWNGSRDVTGYLEHSGSTSRPPLPRPDSGDNYRPVPLWEREFCRNANDIPWETFCGNKRFIAFYKNVLDWDDSGAFKNFEDTKERFRAQYYGEPYEDPVLDPDMYIDEVDHLCKVDPELIVDLDKIAGLAGLDLVADVALGGVDNLIPKGWGEPVPNLVPSGWGELATPTPEAAWGGLGNQALEAVRGAHPYSTPNNRNNNFYGSEVDPGQTSSGTGRKLIGGVTMWISGVTSGGISGVTSGGATKWTGGGGGGNGSGRNQDKGQHQQSIRGGIHCNQDEGRHQQRSGGRQQQGQGVRKMEWRPVRAPPRKMEWRPVRAPPKDDPAA